MDDRKTWRRDAPAAMPQRSLSEAEAYTHLFDLAHESRFDLPAMRGVVEAHPTIHRRLLSAANASQLGTRRKVTRVEHAIMMFGSRGMRAFAEQALPKAVAPRDSREQELAGDDTRRL